MAKLSALQKNFHEAAATDNVAKLKNMIKNIINSQDDEGKMPLLKASNKETINYLIQIGADVNAKDTDGCSALHKAVRNNQIEVVYHTSAHPCISLLPRSSLFMSPNANKTKTSRKHYDPQKNTQKEKLE